MGLAIYSGGLPNVYNWASYKIFHEEEKIEAMNVEDCTIKYLMGKVNKRRVELDVLADSLVFSEEYSSRRIPEITKEIELIRTILEARLQETVKLVGKHKEIKVQECEESRYCDLLFTDKLIRGRSYKSSVFVQGKLFKTDDNDKSSGFYIEPSKTKFLQGKKKVKVIKNTIGVYTGYKDIFDQNIFSNDIVADNKGFLAVVRKTCCGGFYFQYIIDSNSTKYKMDDVIEQYEVVAEVFAYRRHTELWHILNLDESCRRIMRRFLRRRVI